VVDVALRGRRQVLLTDARVVDADRVAQHVVGVLLVGEDELDAPGEPGHPVPVRGQRDAPAVAAQERAEVLVVLADVVRHAVARQRAVVQAAQERVLPERGELLVVTSAEKGGEGHGADSLRRCEPDQVLRSAGIVRPLSPRRGLPGLYGLDVTAWLGSVG
jgi:hypothetical protein